jgi:hypothetical protein
MAATLARPASRIAGLAVVGTVAGYAGSRYYNSNVSALTQVHAESLPSDSKASLNKMPWKGFTELKLESSEMVNHNVKKLTFALPDENSITGIAPISASRPRKLRLLVAYFG